MAKRIPIPDLEDEVPDPMVPDHQMFWYGHPWWFGYPELEPRPRRHIPLEHPGFRPLVNLLESPDAFVLGVRLPGVEAGDVDLTIREDVLILEGLKTRETAQGSYHHYERYAGRFFRQVRLPSLLDPDHTTARFEDGILVVRLSKASQARVHKVPVESAYPRHAVVADAKPVEPNQQPHAERPSSPLRHAVPAVDVIEMDGYVLLLADMPGVGVSDVVVTLDGRQIRMIGRARLRTPAEGFNALHTEYKADEFFRTFRINQRIDHDKTIGAVRNGVLRIQMPRAAHVRIRKVKVVSA